MTRAWRPIARRSSIIIAAAALLFAAGYYIVQRQWNLYVQIGLGLFVIGVAIYVALNPGEIRKALTGRQARYGSNTFITVVAFLGILVVINYLVFNNNKQWDLTADKSNTLAKESVEVLNSIEGNIVAKAFYSSEAAASRGSAQDLLDKYVYEGKGKFQYEFINQNQDPVTWQEAGSPDDRSIVLYLGDSRQTAESGTEEGITGAMVRLLNPEGHGVYFLTGHGELPIDASGDQTFNKLKTTLEGRNYTVSGLNLLTTRQIPQDASVIVIAGPQKPLSDDEVSLLDEFIQNGGSAVIMEEPLIVTQFGDSPDPLAEYLAETYGITLGNDMIVDIAAAQTFQQPFIGIANQYAEHAITQKMSGMVSLFPSARSLTVAEAAEADYSITPLILTSDQSWAETNMVSIQDGSMQADEAEDTFGPITMAVAVQGTSNDSRLVIFGDAEFALNSYFDLYGNGDMIINSIDWAAKEENLISLTPKTTVQRTLIQPRTYTMGLILLGSLIVLPGLILVSGVATWISRRRKG